MTPRGIDSGPGEGYNLLHTDKDQFPCRRVHAINPAGAGPFVSAAGTSAAVEHIRRGLDGYRLFTPAGAVAGTTGRFLLVGDLLYKQEGDRSGMHHFHLLIKIKLNESGTRQ